MSELIQFNHSTTYQAEHKYQLHCHAYYEIYYYIGGDIDYLVEGQHFTPAPHSILLLAPNQFHGVRIHSVSPYERFTLHFCESVISAERKHLLLSIFSAAQSKHPPQVYYTNVTRYLLNHYFFALEHCLHLPEEIQMVLIPVRIEALLSQILVMQQNFLPDVIDADSSMLFSIIRYLNEHITDPITLDEISRKFYISKHHLNKVFRKATGTTVMDYLLHKRIAYSQQLILSGKNASEASYAAGFQDYSSFYRIYRKMLGHSPLEDKKKKVSISNC